MYCIYEVESLFYSMVFVKFMSYSVRSDDSTESCGGTCPGVWVTILSGDRSNGDCRDAAYVNPGKYKQPATVSYMYYMHFKQLMSSFH